MTILDWHSNFTMLNPGAKMALLLLYGERNAGMVGKLLGGIVEYSLCWCLSTFIRDLINEFISTAWDRVPRLLAAALPINTVKHPRKSRLSIVSCRSMRRILLIRQFPLILYIAFLALPRCIDQRRSIICWWPTYNCADLCRTSHCNPIASSRFAYCKYAAPYSADLALFLIEL